MKVEQCEITQAGVKSTISGRVNLSCNVLGPSPDKEGWTRVEITEAGAGLDVGAVITVPNGKLIPD